MKNGHRPSYEMMAVKGVLLEWILSARIANFNG
jgi:hypothetical protein